MQVAVLSTLPRCVTIDKLFKLSWFVFVFETMTVKILGQSKYKQLASTTNDLNSEHINNSIVYKRSHQAPYNGALAVADAVVHCYLIKSRV